MGKIAIVDYDMGNINSVVKAFDALGAESIVTNRKGDFEKAEKIVLPGVGAFGQGMKNLHELGLVEILHNEVIKKKKPFLGLCLGMQLICRSSTELGNHKGLGWIPADVRFLAEKDRNIKVPHIGWNEVFPKNNSVLFEHFEAPQAFYFVHSYQVICDNQKDIAGTCKYGVEFTAAVQHENIYGTQFHPEKSQRVGLLLLSSFINSVIKQ